jgi:CheY-like chemotaxis protein
LNAITGFSTLLANPHLSLYKKEKYIKQILTGGSELINLIDNAIKFTSSGFVELGYSILPSHVQDPKKESLLFFVKDSGIGIAKKDKDRIFERFVKVIDKEGRLYRGARLGLALARDLVHLLNGEIWVESALGKGSTFYFTIPYSRPKVKDKKGKRTDVKEKINFVDKTILIAEDTESNYLYLKEILSSTGAHLLRAKDGWEAIEIFRKNKDTINLIFMDILMPECDGFESSHRIRDIRDDIIIIAQTAFTFEGELEDGLYAGCFTDYILKPFNVKAIYRLLEKYLVRK